MAKPSIENVQNNSGLVGITCTRFVLPLQLENKPTVLCRSVKVRSYSCRAVKLNKTKVLK